MDGLEGKLYCNLFCGAPATQNPALPQLRLEGIKTELYLWFYSDALQK